MEWKTMEVGNDGMSRLNRTYLSEVLPLAVLSLRNIGRSISFPHTELHAIEESGDQPAQDVWHSILNPQWM